MAARLGWVERQRPRTWGRFKHEATWRDGRHERLEEAGDGGDGDGDGDGDGVKLARQYSSNIGQ